MIKMKTLTIGGTTYEVVDAELTENVVMHKEQTLTEEQKAQARANIGINESVNSILVSDGSDTLTWDGNTEGRELVQIEDGAFFVHVSGATPQMNDLTNETYITIMGFKRFAIAQEMIPNQAFSLVVDENSMPPTVVTLADNLNIDGLLFPKKGVYFFNATTLGLKVTSLTIPNYTGFTKEKIDPDYLYQSDWNQTDETAADFIKNKPFGDGLVEIMPETEVVGEDEDGMFTYYLDVSLFTEDETQLKITFDGTEYDCEAYDLYGNTVFGNAGLMGEADTGEPFLLFVNLEYGMAMIALADANAHTIGISKPGVNPIDSKYLLNNCLYSDSTYLYRNPDTSDVSNRITKNELLMYTKREKVVRIYAPIYDSDWGANEHIWNIASFVYVGNAFEYGYVCALENALVGDSSDLILSKLYTAEYTP